MGIPISEYISIASAVVATNDGQRSWAALALTPDTINSGSSLKTDYEAGKVLEHLSLADVQANFANTTAVYKFATKYFSVKDRAGRSPESINIVKCANASAIVSTMTSIIDTFNDFGSFGFIGSGATSANYKAAAEFNAGLGENYAFCVAVNPSNYSEVGTALYNISGTHIVYTDSTSSSDTSDWLEALSLSMGWIACHDYTRANASSTIDYEPFGANASVKDGATKASLDAKRINYVGLVQTRGVQRKFYQTGVNANGVQLGVYIDAAWIRSEIERGWFAIACGSTRVSSDQNGMARVNAMITDSAEGAISNGCILVGKPLSSSQIEQIAEIAGDDSAVVSVQSTGYYVSINLSQDEDGRYTVSYKLIYNKGDHIGKIVGQHYLV